jgi:predicted GNAT family acetyltransferase
MQVDHNLAAARFEVTVEGRHCVADYRLVGSVMAMTHTYVPPALEGRGIAAALVAAALAHARSAGLRVRPSCSYVAAYMRRHRETLDLLEP